MGTWTTADIPDRTGRAFVVTGASAGLVHEATRALTEHGAYVVMACRNQQKVDAARRSLGEHLPARTEGRTLDLDGLTTDRALANNLRERQASVTFEVWPPTMSTRRALAARGGATTARRVDERCPSDAQSR